MRDIHRKTKKELEELLKGKLTKKDKRLIKLALRFGYSNAFCSRTCDMRQEWYSANDYNDVYDNIMKKLE